MRLALLEAASLDHGLCFVYIFHVPGCSMKNCSAAIFIFLIICFLFFAESKLGNTEC